MDTTDHAMYPSGMNVAATRIATTPRAPAPGGRVHLARPCPARKIFSRCTRGTFASSVRVSESTASCSLWIPEGVAVASASEKSATAVPFGNK